LISGNEFSISELLDHKNYIYKHGEDMPEIRNWKWDLADNFNGDS
jgi:xylulose-5-phosphate/fructose-6-phosphate phosphoketolase